MPVTAAAGGAGAQFKEAYTAVPGSCTSDTHCGLYSFCNDDGICESSLTQGRILGGIMPTATVVVVAIFGACAAAIACGCSSYWASPGARCASPGEAGIERAVLSAQAATICCIVTALALGLTLGLWSADVTPSAPGAGRNCTSLQALACEPYFCDLRVEQCFTACSTQAHCSLGAECKAGVCVSTRTNLPSNSEGQSQPKNPAGRVAAIAIFSALGWFCLCSVSALFWNINANKSDYDWYFWSKCCATTGCIAIALGLGLGLGLPRATIVPIMPAINSTTCAGDRACAPYLCNEDIGACYDACATSDDCFTSFSCSAGKCVPGFAGVEVRSVSVGGTVAIVAAIAVFICCCFSCFFYKCDPCSVYNQEERMVGGLFCALLFTIVVVVVAGPLIGLAKHDVEFAHPAPLNGTAHCAQADALACAPYYCDLTSSKCRASCAADDECITGAKCSKSGECVYDGPSRESMLDSKRRTLPAWATTIIALVSPLPLVVLLLGVFILFTVFRNTRYVVDHEYDLAPASCNGAILCCVIIALTVGLALGLTQVAGSPSPHAGTVTPHLAPAFPTWFVVTVTMAAACGSCGLVLVIARCTLSLPWRAGVMSLVESDSHTAKAFSAFCYLVITFAVVMTAVGVGMGTQTKLVVPAAPGAVNGTSCVTATDPRCFPFRCDVYAGTCYDSCTTSEECIDGQQCRAGQCATPPYSGLLRPRRLSAVVVAGAVLLAFSLCFICISSTAGWRPRARLWLSGFQRYRVPLISVTSCCCAVFVGVVVAMLLLMWSRVDDVAPVAATGAGARTCHHIADLACAPYLCDSITSSCYNVCSSDRHCQDYYECDKAAGKCVYASRDWARFIGNILIAVLATGLVLGMASFRLDHLYTARKMKAALRRREEFLRRLQEFKAQQAAIEPVVLDVDTPVGEDGPDPTLPTPAGASAGEGAAFDFEGAEPVDMDALAAAGTAAPAPHTSDVCGICYFAPSTVRFVRKNCTHGFCNECAASSLQMIIDTDQFPARCPGCLAEDMGLAPDDPMFQASLIESGIIERLARRMVIAIDFARRFISLQLMKAFASDDIVMCPACSLLNIKPDWEAVTKSAPNRYVVTCPNCTSEFCAECLGFSFEHDGYTCEEYARAMERGDDRQTQAFIASTSKPCPSCGVPTSRWRGHACHHITPGTGCVNCGHHYCIVCLQPHPCGGSDHGLFCDDRCDCLPCPDCRPGSPCAHCYGDESCPSCHPPRTADAMRNHGFTPNDIIGGFGLQDMGNVPLQPIPRPPSPPPMPHEPGHALDDLLGDLGLDYVPPGFWDPVIPLAPSSPGDVAGPSGAAGPSAPLPLAAQRDTLLPPRRLVIPEAGAGMTLHDHIRLISENGPDRLPPAPPPLPPPDWRRSWRNATSHITARSPEVVPVPAATRLAPRRLSDADVHSTSRSASSASDDGIQLEPVRPRPSRLQLPTRGPATDGHTPESANDRASPLYLRRGLNRLELTPEAVTSASSAGVDDNAANVFDFSAFPRTARENLAPVTSRWLSPLSASRAHPATASRRPLSSEFFRFDAPQSGGGRALHSADGSTLPPVVRTPASAQRPRIAQFMAITGVATERIARNYLSLFNFDLASAVHYHNDVEATLQARNYKSTASSESASEAAPPPPPPPVPAPEAAHLSPASPRDDIIHHHPLPDSEGSDESELTSSATETSSTASTSSSASCDGRAAPTTSSHVTVSSSSADLV
ncbi:uncharacterized protein AMSG_04901 [Thecamonas trahens ATCC 50062]|uniref:RING-type domain-containing protein n=1 Tax=Thecamonas trahens ATCC 50062 TaxID=461836 RepID=A0A0L0D889_THETB|nr:hypothetical protein AMSG_04901 [Thecamonas trahens ATCC 50062]KNC48455.1 hypothetical protein AMSG_04901 [Thecamonas trahens ATCC 50062]|eukprot:XP_013758568.1 hypothetical protein AMSG_04901 [Thecamonas trahens ATCC 50062]